MLFTGLFHPSFWELLGIVLVLTHITIVAVTVFLHRCQAHRALELGPVASHFFRFWLWLTTGMVTKEWAAIHRKHHAKCETVEDPHSPQILGINKVLWTGVLLYVKESRNKETMVRYGHGTPDDWMERNFYSAHEKKGVVLMALIDMACFGIVPGLLVWVVQMAWIPFWAAGVINGLGHFWGYRNFQAKDASTNLSPWGILIGGEELHNNHHAYATSAKLSNRWFEFDIGWMYIRLLAMVGQAKVKNVAPSVRLDRSKTECDLDTLHAVITHRYDVLAKYARDLADHTHQELDHLRQRIGGVQAGAAAMARALQVDESQLDEGERLALGALLEQSAALRTVYQMRQELVSVWTRTNASREQLLRQLEDWCVRAEQSDIAGLKRFSRRLRCYV
ncbi:MAG: fatty acid desaturase [Pseudomonadota bacterium]|nr:fatty acid desaturase [Pseudomonadota bacterium]